jgi:hypothetical protein
VDIDNNSGNSAGEASGLSAVATIGISFGAVLIVLVLAFVGYRFYLSSNSKTPLAAAEGAPVAGAGAGAGTDTVQLEEGATVTTENPMQQRQRKKGAALHRPTATVDSIDVYVEKPFPLNPVSSTLTEEL